MGPGDETLSGLPAGDRAVGGVCAFRVPWQGGHGWSSLSCPLGPGPRKGEGVPGGLGSTFPASHFPCLLIQSLKLQGVDCTAVGCSLAESDGPG